MTSSASHHWTGSLWRKAWRQSTSGMPVQGRGIRNLARWRKRRVAPVDLPAIALASHPRVDGHQLLSPGTEQHPRPRYILLAHASRRVTETTHVLPEAWEWGRYDWVGGGEVRLRRCANGDANDRQAVRRPRRFQYGIRMTRPPRGMRTRQRGYRQHGSSGPYGARRSIRDSQCEGARALRVAR
jgi:hypothetical protein